MATLVTYNEITCFVKLPSHIISERNCYFSYLYSNYRYAYQYYYKLFYTKRNIYYQNNLFINEKLVLAKRYIYSTYTSNIFAFTPLPIEPKNERYIIYLVDAQKYVRTIKTILPFSIIDERTILIGFTNITQREVVYVTSSYNEKYIIIQTNKVKNLKSLYTLEKISHNNERQCIVIIGNIDYSKRNILFFYNTFNEQIIYFIPFREVKVKSPTVYESISGNYSDVICSIKLIAPYSNRTIFVKRSIDCDRYVMFNIKAISERNVYFIPNRVMYSYDVLFIQAILKVNERYAIYNAYRIDSYRYITFITDNGIPEKIKYIGTTPKDSFVSKYDNDLMFNLLLNTIQTEDYFNIENTRRNLYSIDIAKFDKYVTKEYLSSIFNQTFDNYKVIKGTIVGNNLGYSISSIESKYRKILYIGKFLCKIGGMVYSDRNVLIKI